MAFFPPHFSSSVSFTNNSLLLPAVMLSAATPVLLPGLRLCGALCVRVVEQ